MSIIKTCSVCDGSGKDNRLEDAKCTLCKGYGFVAISDFNLIQKRTPVGAEATVVIVGLSEISSKRYYSMMGNKKLKIIEIREN